MLMKTSNVPNTFEIGINFRKNPPEISISDRPTIKKITEKRFIILIDFLSDKYHLK